MFDHSSTLQLFPQLSWVQKMPAFTSSNQGGLCARNGCTKFCCACASRYLLWTVGVAKLLLIISDQLLIESSYWCWAFLEEYAVLWGEYYSNSYRRLLESPQSARNTHAFGGSVVSSNWNLIICSCLDFTFPHSHSLFPSMTQENVQALVDGLFSQDQLTRLASIRWYTLLRGSMSNIINF